MENPKPELVFKGRGKRVNLTPPEGMNHQWLDSGQYQFENVVKTVHNLPQSESF